MFVVEMRKMFSGLINLAEWHQPFESEIWGGNFLRGYGGEARCEFEMVEGMIRKENLEAM
jgi:hypothetical protein